MKLLIVLLLVAPAFAGCADDLLSIGRVTPSDYIEEGYGTWLIEVDYVSGETPDSSALNTLKSRLGQLVHKDRIDIRLDDQIAGRSTWGNGDLDRAFSGNKDAKTGGDQVVTHVLYVDGEYSDGNVAGITFNYDRIVIFHESIDSACNNLFSLCFGAEDDLETAVLVHEFGHALGLVNRGVDMHTDHEDDAHPNHSDNTNSVMWWEVDGSFSFANLNSIPTTFDSDDRRDICLAGGKGNC